ncbi:branched-chain amino acid ABC transporter permease/ATP-binding protein (plasmid) [Embleya sp. NBC_00888]|uniref:branched-chain amino acid ABC transporter permease/ATP-binding protein n=1 Tax=Embleya sp. NBC_00888 TaxID=2975960 RepID=UPI002F914EAD|nr:branched-chain amino acid ABC transporter permease/ATP-binding protein [Embleya sp. NBC_00888]
MEDIAYYGLIGLGPGAMLGLLALGLVLVYRGTGVLNLAHTSQAALGAYMYAYFSNSMGIPLALSLLAAVLCAGLSGVLVQLLVMRPLRLASPLTQLIASTGVLLVIQAGLLLAFTSDAQSVKSLLPTAPLDLWDGRSIGRDRLLLVVVAIVVTTILWAIFRYSRYGAITAAVAENPIAGQTLGHDPGRIAIGSWFLGGVLAGLAGSLLAPLSGLNLVAFLSLLVPVLAAALGGGLVSFPLTIVGGIGIGVAQSEATVHTDVRGAGTIATFALLVLLMLLRGRAIPSRGFVGTRMPSLGDGRIRWALVLPTFAVTILLVWVVLPVEWNFALLTSLLVAIPMLSVVVVTGYAGQVSLAPFALAGVGAVVASELAHDHPGIPFLLLLLIGGICAIPFGFVLAFTARRMRGASLGIITLGFSVLLYATVFSRSDLVTVPSPTILGLDLTPIIDPRRYLTVVILVFVIFGLLVANLRRSQGGRRLIAVRGNERAAASIGINVNGAKTTAFVISAFIAAVGGVLLAFRSTAVVYGNFDPLSSISQLGWTVIGGLGWIIGPLVGMTFASGGVGNQVVASAYNDQFAWLPMVGGVVLLVTILLNPDGIVSVNVSLVRRLATRRRRNAPARIPEPATPQLQRGTRTRRALTLTDVRMSFGAVHVLKGVSLTVEPGTVHGLIGPNGAGKTTLLDVISGFAHPQSGQVCLGNDSLRRMPTWKRSRLGIGRSFQSLELFDDLDVYDNIRAASEINRRDHVVRELIRPQEVSLSPAGWEAVRLLELDGVLDRRIEELSYGKRHLVAIARALATDSDIVLLDEPAAGLDEVETAELRTLIRRIAEQSGIGVLLIEHDVELVMDVSDVVTALNFGEVIASGAPSEVRKAPEVIASYLGEEIENVGSADLTAGAHGGVL